MKNDFEYMRYSDSDRLAMLETRAAEIERMLGSTAAEPAAPDTAGAPDYPTASIVYPAPAGLEEPGEYPGAFEYPQGAEDEESEYDESADEEPDGRTEVLISRGRQNVRPSRFGYVRTHWKAIGAAAGALALLGAIVSVVSSGGSASWPASVTTMQSEITVACENSNVAAEPSQLNFACAKDTQQILWVFGLLTSGGNPAYVDPSTGRKGLEPITPSQGGDVAWSLNLHSPYNPASATDSLAVAARAINNIISGATLTSTSGTPSVQGGLESSAANCERYTGSRSLDQRSGYPAVCAHGVTSVSGQEALVSDVFRQWMVGAPAQLATDAGVLFVNADNPGNQQVRQILQSLPGSGL
jgi:hypothetical protein